MREAGRTRIGRWLPLLTASIAAGCASGGRPQEPAVPGPGAAGAPDRTERLVGGCGRVPAGLVPRYLLPFPVGHQYQLAQGNCGSASHDGRFRYAFDFRMPIGTPVTAARDGVVALVRDDRPDGTHRVGDENLVILSHLDGEMSRYIHLMEGGVLVEVGQRVSAGDTIARSGNSGQSSFPHLHFDVSDRCDTEGCRTVPSAFLNAVPPIPTDRAPVRALPWEESASGSRP